MIRRGAIRAMSRRRTERLGVSEASYRLYLGVMLAIIVAAPAVRVLLLGLAADLPGFPSAVATGERSALDGPASVLAAVLTAATAALVLAGSIGGPALPSLPQLDLLHTSAIPRARLLARGVLRAGLWGALAGAAVTALVIAARTMRGEATVAWALAFGAAGIGIGLTCAAALLVGQLGRPVRAAVAGALAALALARLARASDRWPSPVPAAGDGALPDPWSTWAALALGIPGSGGAGLAPGLWASAGTWIALGVGLGLTLCGPWLGARIRWEALRAQAARWDIVRVLAVTGDPNAALARLGAPVRLGRRLRLRGRRRDGARRGAVALLLRRDLLGVVRAPGRGLAAFVAVSAGGALWAAALGAGNGDGAGGTAARAAALGAIALVTCALGIQPWCRGLAAAAAASGSPPLLPLSPGALLACHLVLPGALGVLAAVGGACSAVLGAASGAVGVDPSSVAGVLVSAAAAAIVAVLLRLVAVLKGPIPMELLAPIPTPVGDAAGIRVVLWILDGPLASALLGAVLAPLWAAGASGAPAVALAATVGVALLLVVWARRRLGGGAA
ncbi:hypothetical protein D3248_12080 [Leucobacter zeae]|nr:hypothetical protein [Leucobacter zeae]